MLSLVGTIINCICPHYIRESKIVYEKQRRKCNREKKKQKKGEEQIAKIVKYIMAVVS